MRKTHRKEIKIEARRVIFARLCEIRQSTREVGGVFGLFSTPPCINQALRTLALTTLSRL